MYFVNMTLTLLVCVFNAKFFWHNLMSVSWQFCSYFTVILGKEGNLLPLLFTKSLQPYVILQSPQDY